MFYRFLVLFLAIFLATSVFAKKNQEFIYLNQGDNLQFIVMDNMHDYGGTNFHRFYYFKSTLNGLLEEVDFPMSWKVNEFGFRTPKDVTCVYITVQKWGLDRMGQVEARLSAYLRSPMGEKNSLGHYRHDDFAIGMLSGSLREKAYNKVLKRALLKMVKDLNEHFPLSEEAQEPAVPTENGAEK